MKTIIKEHLRNLLKKADKYPANIHWDKEMEIFVRMPGKYWDETMYNVGKLAITFFADEYCIVIEPWKDIYWRGSKENDEEVLSNNQ